MTTRTRSSRKRPPVKPIADERDDALLRAMDALNDRIGRLEDSRDPIDCVAQGRLEAALWAISEAANLLGEGR